MATYLIIGLDKQFGCRVGCKTYTEEEKKMVKTFTVRRELSVNPMHQLTGCTADCECGYYYYPEQLGGDGRVAGFRALRTNGDYARFRSYSGAYKFGKRYFGEG